MMLKKTIRKTSRDGCAGLRRKAPLLGFALVVAITALNPVLPAARAAPQTGHEHAQIEAALQPAGRLLVGRLVHSFVIPPGQKHMALVWQLRPERQTPPPVPGGDPMAAPARVRLDSVVFRKAELRLAVLVPGRPGLAFFDDSSAVRAVPAVAVAPGDTVTAIAHFRTRLREAHNRTSARAAFYDCWFPLLRADSLLAPAADANAALSVAAIRSYEIRLSTPASWMASLAAGSSEIAGRNPVQFRFQAVPGPQPGLFVGRGYVAHTDSLQHISLSFLLPASAGAGLERVRTAVSSALQFLETWLGPIPASQLTFIDVPFEFDFPAHSAPGWRFLVFMHGLPASAHFLEQEIFTACAKVYFAGVTPVERDTAGIFIEALATYAGMRLLESLYGKNSNLIAYVGHDLPVADYLKVLSFQSEAGRFLSRWLPAAVRQGLQRQAAVAREALVLATLENYAGQPAWQDLLRRFCAMRQQGPAGQAALLQLLREAGRDTLAVFAQRMLLAGQPVDSVDYRITRLITSDAIFRASDPEPLVEKPSRINPAAGGDGQAGVGPVQRQTRVYVARRGSAALPAEVELVLASGAKLRQVWDGAGKTAIISFDHAGRVRKATVDPENKILVDQNRLNNSRTPEPSANDERLALRVMFWIQNILHFVTTWL